MAAEYVTIKGTDSGLYHTPVNMTSKVQKTHNQQIKCKHISKKE